MLNGTNIDRSHLWLLGIAVFLTLLISNAHNIYAVFWKADNATVFLSRCNEDCELKGTLAVQPFDGRYYIENESGKTYLEPNSYARIEYPINKP